MKQTTLPYRPISAIQLTLIIISFISVLYPLFFAYIDNSFSIRFIFQELLFTLLRLGGITFICYGVIRLTDGVVKKRHWLLHAVELLVIFVVAYWFLYFFVEWIDRPLTGSNPADPKLWTFRRYIGLYLLGTLFIYTFLSGLNFYQLAREKAAQSERLQRAYAQIRLHALKSQVNPHFLFNSLSVLSSLVHVDPEVSEQFIIQLSKAYRYILDQKETELVSLQEELNFLDAYFFLLQIRFNKKIVLEKEVEEEARTLRLPPLTLQLLMENAVKHNKMSAGAPLSIVVRTEGGWLTVRNNINLRDQQEASTGVGLENIQKRYALITTRNVVIEKSEDYFTVQVPLIK